MNEAAVAALEELLKEVESEQYYFLGGEDMVDRDNVLSIIKAHINKAQGNPPIVAIQRRKQRDNTRQYSPDYTRQYSPDYLTSLVQAGERAAERGSARMHERAENRQKSSD